MVVEKLPDGGDEGEFSDGDVEIFHCISEDFDLLAALKERAFLQPQTGLSISTLQCFVVKCHLINLYHFPQLRKVE